MPRGLRAAGFGRMAVSCGQSVHQAKWLECCPGKSMSRRVSRPGELWIVGIVSAILLCLGVAADGVGGSPQSVASGAGWSTSNSGGLDVSHKPSSRFILTSNRQVLVAAKPDEKSGSDHPGGADPAILPDDLALSRLSVERLADATAECPPRTAIAKGYHARGPPALI